MGPQKSKNGLEIAGPEVTLNGHLTGVRPGLLRSQVTEPELSPGLSRQTEGWAVLTGGDT